MNGLMTGWAAVSKSLIQPLLQALQGYLTRI